MTRTRPKTILLGLALLLGACSAPVAAGLDDGDATDVVVALEKGGVPADKEVDTDKEGAYRVVVNRDDAARALRILSDEGLPPRPMPGVLDALGKGSMVPSRLAEQAKLVTGTSGELERSLRGLDGVVSARVHLGVAPHDPLAVGEVEPEVTASVLLRHHGPTPPLTASEIQRLVAGAVPGLAPEHVSVVLSSVPPAPSPSEHDLARLGPLTVVRTSLPALRAMLAVGVLSNVVLLGCLFLLWSRVKKSEGALAASRSDEPAPAGAKR